MPDTKTAVPTRPMPDAIVGERLGFDGKRLDTGIEQVQAAPARAGFVGGNPRPAKMLLESRIDRVFCGASREGHWGWDGACLETVSAIAHDPIGYDGEDLNLYRYLFNSPTGLTDPTGEHAILSLVGVGWVGGTSPIQQATDLLRQLKQWLDAIPCKCELAVSGIPWAIDYLLLPDRQNGKPQWPWQHCASNCMMVSMCGGGEQSEQCAAWLSLAKEVLDLAACVIVDHGHGDSCDSAFQQSDFQDNAAGRDFGPCCSVAGAITGPVGAGACCAVACAGRFNAPEGPGTDRPFGPFGDPPGPWPTVGDILDDLW